MDLEPLPLTPLSASLALPTADSDMPIEIDYDDADLASVLEPAGEGEVDAPMEDDAATSLRAEGEGEMSVEKGEMQHEGEGEVEVVMAEEEEAVLPAVEETGEEVPIAVETPAAESVEVESAATSTAAPTAEVDLAPATLAAETPAPPLPDLAEAPATLTSASLPLDAIPGVDSQTSAEVDVEATAEDAIVEPIDLPVAGEIDEAAALSVADDSDDIDLTAEEYFAVPAAKPDADVLPASTSTSTSTTHVPLPFSASSTARPPVDKDPLLPIDVPARPSADSSSSSPSRGVPAIFLTHDNTTYSLFHSHRLLSTPTVEGEIRSEADDAPSSAPADSDEAPPVLLSSAIEHKLYYQPVDKLFRALREQFGEFQDGQDELVLDFDEIGVSLGEDNVYCTQVTLFDFDRIHLGCQLPGRLHARLYAQGRFATGFNALAQHIKNSYGAAAGGEKELIENREEEEAVIEGEEDGDESGTLAAEDEDEEFATEDTEGGGAAQDEGQEEQHEESVHPRTDESLANDFDGPDSALLGGDGGSVADETESTDHEHEREQRQQLVAENGEDDDDAYGTAGEDEFDLDQALAQLDGDDVVAVIEGAEEDWLLSGGGGEGGEEGEAEPTAEEDEGKEANHQEGEGDAMEDAEVVEPETIAEVGSTEILVEEGEGEKEEEDVQDSVEEVQPAPIEAAPSLDVDFSSEQQQQEPQPTGDEPPAVNEADIAALVPGEPTFAADTSTVDPAVTVEGEPATVTEVVESVEPSESVELAPPTEDAAPVKDGSPDASAAVEDTLEIAYDSAGATDAAPIPTTEELLIAEPAEVEAQVEADVVIDYDEVFDPSSAAAPAAVVESTAADQENGANGAHEEIGEEGEKDTLSPKRSRDEGEKENGTAAKDGDEAGEAKRPRFTADEPLVASSA